MAAIEQAQLGAKCKVVEGDFRQHTDLLRQADVLFMNNVFSFFADKTAQEQCWNDLKAILRPQTILVHNHTLRFVTKHLNLNFDVETWAELVSQFLKL